MPFARNKLRIVLLLSMAAIVAAISVGLLHNAPDEQDTKIYTAASSRPLLLKLQDITTTTSTTVPPTTTTTAPPPTTTTTAPPPPPTTQAPPPPPTTDAAPAEVRAGNCAGWEGLIAQYFPGEVATACRVMMCETGNTGDPHIHNPSSTASGLWQFLDGTWEATTGTPAPAANYSAETQTAAAAKLRNSSGWSQWSCY